MLINPFGYILIFIVIMAIFNSFLSRSASLFLTFLKFELIFSFFKFNYGYFFYIGNSEIQYGEIFIGLLAIIGFWNIYFIKIKKNLLFNGLFLLFVILMGIFVLILFPSNAETINFNTAGGWDGYLRGKFFNMQPVSFSMQSILMLIRIICFIVVLVAAKSLLKKQDWFSVLNFLLFFSKLFIIFAFVEYILRFYLTIDLNEYFNFFFGRGISTGADIERLQGFSREPSYYALAIYNVSLLFFLNLQITKNLYSNISWIVAITFIGISSGAFSYLWVFSCLFIFVTFFTIFNFNLSARRLLVFFNLSLFIVVPVITLYALNSNSSGRIIEAALQLQKSILGTYVIGMDASSEASRFIGIVESFKSYLDRPLIGLGIGTTYCTSGIISILANTGLIGLILWIRLLITQYFKIRFIIGMSLFLPILITNDFGSFYDFAYISIIPLIYYAMTANTTRNQHKISL